MQTQNPTEIRKLRGQYIAQTSRIARDKKGRWKVPSQSGQGFYFVKSDGSGASCQCKDFKDKGGKCKHIWAIELSLKQQVEKVLVELPVKPNYRQDWPNYRLSRKNEKEVFMELLADLMKDVNNPAYEFGRPKNLLSDMIYAMVFKVYSTFSGDRFATDMRWAVEKEYLTKEVPCNSMFDYFNKEELTPLLSELVRLTALPVASVERDFAIDSTGFGTSNFQRWYSFKHGKDINMRKWVKAHFISGVKTNIITSVKITTELDNDCPQLPELFEKTKEYFDMEQLSADKAYLSRFNLELIEDSGVKAFIPFKINSTPNRKGKVWKKLYHYSNLYHDEFLRYYHKRSNVESTVNMIRAKFGKSVRSKNWNSQVNEVLCKVICHNICVVIKEMFCRNINPNFNQTESDSLFGQNLDFSGGD